MKHKEGFEMKTSRLLISSAMLTAMSDQQALDNLKLLERFVTMCIADSTVVGGKIDKSRILELMDQQYAFSNMPLPVLDKILQRMVRSSDHYVISAPHGNYKLASKAFNDIYQKIREFENCLLAETYHFNLLKEGHGKFSVCADRAYRICQLAFTEKDEVIGGFSEKVVYQSLFDEIEDSLEWFRCEIYKNEKYEAIEKKPILGTVQVLSFEEKKK